MNTVGLTRNAWQVSETSADLRRGKQVEQSISFHAEPQHLTIDLNKTALIIIDMQNDFCSAGGWLDHIGADFTPARAPITPLNEFMPELRKRAVPIIWVNWGNRPDRANLNPSIHHAYNMFGNDAGLGGPLPSNGSKVLEKGSWGAAIIDEMNQEDTDLYIDKYRMSGFIDTALDSILRNLGVTTLLFAGVNLDQCVMATVQDAVNNGYDSIVLTDCSATTSPEFCTEATYYNIKQCYGFLASSEVILSQLA